MKEIYIDHLYPNCFCSYCEKWRKEVHKMMKSKRGTMSKQKKGESKLEYEKRRRKEANARWHARQKSK